jgi:hypothetical protein
LAAAGGEGARSAIRAGVCGASGRDGGGASAGGGAAALVGRLMGRAARTERSAGGGAGNGSCGAGVTGAAIVSGTRGSAGGAAAGVRGSAAKGGVLENSPLAGA